MIVDFRGGVVKRLSTSSILGEEAEVVEDYGYLDVPLDNRLDCKCYAADLQLVSSRAAKRGQRIRKAKLCGED